MNETGIRAKPAREPLAAHQGSCLDLEASVTQTANRLVGTWQVFDQGAVVAGGTVTLTGDAAPKPPPVADWALFAALPGLISRGGAVRFRGAATRRALADAAELSRAWASFCRDRAAPLVLDADVVVDQPELAAPGRVAAVFGAGEDVPPIPPTLTLCALVVDGEGSVPAAGEAARLTMIAEAPEGPPPGFFRSAVLRAAALHLLAGEARYGLLPIPVADTPRLGEPASPAQAAAFLSGGCVEVIPLLATGERFVARTALARPALSTAPGPIVAHFEQTVREGATRRALILEGLADRPAGERETMWWEMPGETDMPTPPVLDQMVAPAVMAALARGQDLVVHGPISRLASVNLPMLAAARAAWGDPAPGGAVAVVADTVCDPLPLPHHPLADPARAVLTFSGGADSFYSALWRTGPDAPPAEPVLAGAVLSLGFDIPLTGRSAFEAISSRLAAVLARRGVTLHVVHTNTRALGLSVWEPSAMPMISAALSQFAHRYRWGLLSGGRTYPDQNLPIIQAALLDRMLSGDWFSTASDAASVGRTEKVALIARHPEAMAVLRVCYNERSADFSRNCCVCAKCQRTMLNFLAAGVARPPCFDTVIPPEELVALPISRAEDLAFGRDLVAYAKAHGTAAPWTTHLDWRLRSWHPAMTAAERLEHKVRLWAWRFATNPGGTPALAARKLIAKLRRIGRKPP